MKSTTIELDGEYTTDDLLDRGYYFEKMHIDSEKGRYVSKLMKGGKYIGNIFDIGNTWWKVTDIYVDELEKQKYIALISESYVYGSHTNSEEFFSDLEVFGEELTSINEENGRYDYTDLSGPIFLGVVEAISKEEALEAATEDFMLPKAMIEVLMI